MSRTTRRSEWRAGVSRGSALLIALLLVAGCSSTPSDGGGGGADDGGGGQARPERSTLAFDDASVDPGVGSQPVDGQVSDAELEAIVDAIVADAEAEIDPAVSGANGGPMPPSLDDYFDSRSVQEWALVLDSPLVKSTCKLAGLPKAGVVLEAAVGLLFQRFKVRQSIKGLAKVVAAANLGCKYLVAPLSEMIQKRDAVPLPTPGPEPTSSPAPTPPPAAVYQASLGEFVPFGDGADVHMKVAVIDVRCPASVGGYVPTQGYRFIAARVRVDALVEGVPFDTYYWQVAADGVPGALVANDDPNLPAFGYGRLPAGYSASGWIVYIVRDPTTSIVVRYRGDPYSPEPSFEVPRGACSA